MLVARKASCFVANAFLSGLKLIWPRSSLKSTKVSKKCIFLQKVPGVNGLKSSSDKWLYDYPLLIFMGKNELPGLIIISVDRALWWHHRSQVESPFNFFCRLYFYIYNCDGLSCITTFLYLLLCFIFYADCV